MAMPGKCCICGTEDSLAWIGINMGEMNDARKDIGIKNLGWYKRGDKLVCKGCAIELLQRLAAIFRCSITIHCLCECNIPYDKTEIKRCAGDATPCW